MRRRLIAIPGPAWSAFSSGSVAQGELDPADERQPSAYAAARKTTPRRKGRGWSWLVTLDAAFAAP